VLPPDYSGDIPTGYFTYRSRTYGVFVFWRGFFQDLSQRAHARPANLSGGQQQRVAIARALALDPKAMLFDEPTSALDPEMISEVLDVMVELAGEGMTMLVVTHEMGFARSVADRIVFMDRSEIVEDTPTDQFFSAPKSQRAQEFLFKVLAH
jgi:glutamate/aspartate transport system ATP-binding protein